MYDIMSIPIWSLVKNVARLPETRRGNKKRQEAWWINGVMVLVAV